MFNILLIALFSIVLAQITIIQKEQDKQSKRLESIENRLERKRKNFDEFKDYIESLDDLPKEKNKPPVQGTESLQPNQHVPKRTTFSKTDFELNEHISQINFRETIGELKVNEVLQYYIN